MKNSSVKLRYNNARQRLRATGLRLLMRVFCYSCHVKSIT